MGRLVEMLVGAAAVAAGTAAGGWWTVPLVGAAWALVRRQVRPVTVAAGAALTWAALLGWRALTGEVAALADRLAGVFGLPAPAVLAAGPLYAALLAGLAAILVRWLRPAGSRR